jgi:hypothetical protein
MDWFSWDQNLSFNVTVCFDIILQFNRKFCKTSSVYTIFFMKMMVIIIIFYAIKIYDSVSDHKKNNKLHINLWDDKEDIQT